MRRCAGGERESRRDKGTEAIVKQSNGNLIYLSVLAESGGEEVKEVFFFKDLRPAVHLHDALQE